MGPSTAANSTAGGHTAIRCADGLLLPCWQPLVDVALTERVGRGVVYFCALAYLFVGVSIVSDRFMAAIEVITSQEREVAVRRASGEPHIVVVRMWNETVANLTLMALGSSAPEILLSVIEIYAKNFEAGDLGPGTIVGSAAYNLFVIIALCVGVIPKGESRKIKHLGVFFVTASWSVFAYVWLYLILCFFSPGVVDIWEGVLTFCFFPLTVLTAYAADRNIHRYIRKDYRMNRRGVIVQAEGGDRLEMGNGELLPAAPEAEGGARDDDAKREYVATLRELRREHPRADLAALEKMAHETLLGRGPKSRAFYRIQATRKLMGSGDLLRRISERAQSDLSEIKEELRRESAGDCAITANCDPAACRVFFSPAKYAVMESCGRFEVSVVREGDVEGAVDVEYRTEDGSAVADSDYVRSEGWLHFQPGDKEKKITLEVIDDDVFEPDEHFYVRLCAARPSAAAPEAPACLLGSPAKATVLILDDDHGGLFRFDRQNHELVESQGQYELKVVRCSGARGRVVVPFWTEDGTAKQGKEYEKNKGEIVFENNESE
ncbi:unnamed protein product [Phaedon cochleariae]|uniref:Calx-beta domain-containing protein n=1 Tax=Phaedon cochleariae TaxID=80249 RepID=A0A9P0DSQ5_PHACE|nr:unnamed protein product [Phaedon cochleariae]